MKALAWTGGPSEWYGKRGNRIIAMIVLSQDGYGLYDQRDAENASVPDKLAGLVDSLEEAKSRAVGW